MWDWYTYILFLTALLVGYFFINRYDQNKDNKGLGEIWLIVGLLPTFLLMSLRGREVGIDLVRYEVHVLDARYGINYYYLFSEPIFQFVYWISYKLGGLQAFIVLTSFLEYIFLFQALRLLHNKGLEVKIVYVFFYAYVMIRSFNIVRNGIAWSCSLCAYTYLIGGNPKDRIKFWTYSLIAFGMHNSAIINFIIYFVCWPLTDIGKAKSVWVRSLFVMIVTFLFFYFGRSVLSVYFNDLTEDRYGGNLSMREGFGVGNIIWRLPFLFLILYSWPLLKKRFDLSFYPIVGLFMFDLVVVQLKYLSTSFERLTQFTGLAQVMLWGMLAMVYQKKGNLSNSLILTIGIICFTYYMYHWGVLGGGGNGIGIMPYKFWDQ